MHRHGVRLEARRRAFSACAPVWIASSRAHAVRQEVEAAEALLGALLAEAPELVEPDDEPEEDEPEVDAPEEEELDDDEAAAGSDDDAVEAAVAPEDARESFR